MAAKVCMLYVAMGWPRSSRYCLGMAAWWQRGVEQRLSEQYETTTWERGTSWQKGFDPSCQRSNDSQRMQRRAHPHALAHTARQEHEADAAIWNSCSVGRLHKRAGKEGMIEKRAMASE